MAGEVEPESHAGDDLAPANDNAAEDVASEATRPAAGADTPEDAAPDARPSVGARQAADVSTGSAS